VSTTASTDEWGRYGRTLIEAMAEVLAESPPHTDELLLETADFWLSLGIAIGLERAGDAARLLDTIEAHEGNRAELAEDAAAFCRGALP
jgi:hypothetical protein